MTKPIVINETFNKEGERNSITIRTENPYQEELHDTFVKIVRLVKGKKRVGISLSTTYLPNKRRLEERDEQNIAQEFSNACWNLAHDLLINNKKGTLF